MKDPVHRIFLADDHRIVLDGLEIILSSDPGFLVVGKATNGQDALDLGRDLNPDLVLLDLHMPGLTGLEVGEKLKQERPGIRVVLLTMHTGNAVVHQVRAAGLDGCLMKNIAAGELRSALYHVLDGRSWFPSRETNGNGIPKTSDLLTPRETELLRWIVMGSSNIQTSERMGITVRTVETHRKNIIQKLGTSKVSDLVRIAQALGLV